MKKLLLSFILFITSLQASTLSLEYNKATTQEDKEVFSLLKNSKRLEKLEKLLNEIFIFKSDVTVLFGTEDGPYFDPAKNLIAIPYTFFSETKNKLKKDNYEKREKIDLNTASMDVLIHSIIHELGHALVAMYNIPILGKEEDAVDNLANIVLIDFFENGDDILLTNADIFDLYGDEKKALEEQDFMDEHSLDLQRFYSLLCFVYASNPEKYEEMLTQYEFPMYRKDMCVDELNNISSSWYQVLKPHMRD